MPFINPHNAPIFKTIEEMMEYYYPASPEEMIQKADAPLLSSTTGWHNIVYGSIAFAQLSYESNAFAILPKLPWNKSGFRVQSAYPVATGSWPNGGVAENATITDSDSIKPTWQALDDVPKTILHFFDASDVAAFLSKIDDSIEAVDNLRMTVGDFHVLQMNEMLMTDNDTLAANNLESIDRMIGSYSEINGCGQTAGDLDVYGLDRDAGATFADAVVSHNSAVDRELTLNLIDVTYRNILKNGGAPKVILTGHDTFFEWQALLEAQRRYLSEKTVKATFAGVQAQVAGVEGGFAVSTYHGIPIIPTQRCTSDGISRIFFIDTDHMYIKVAQPTQYDESEDVLALDRLGMRGAYRTMAELTCTRFNVQGKIRDLKASS